VIRYGVPTSQLRGLCGNCEKKEARVRYCEECFGIFEASHEHTLSQLRALLEFVEEYIAWANPNHPMALRARSYLAIIQENSG
jgi:predicted amidophosphoribosyltransferase